MLHYIGHIRDVREVREALCPVCVVLMACVHSQDRGRDNVGTEMDNMDSSSERSVSLVRVRRLSAALRLGGM